MLTESTTRQPDPDARSRSAPLSTMPSPRAPARPLLCTVNRGARSICASADGAYHIGHALASSPSNDVTCVRRFATGLAVTSSTSHAFEVWSLTALSASTLLLGTRSGGYSHVRLLAADASGADGPASAATCGPELALAGRLLSVHAPPHGPCVAVTHAGISLFAADAGAELSVAGAPRPERDAEVVAGGLCGGRAFVALADGRVVLHDPREERAVKISGHPLGIPSRAARVACAAGAPGAIILGTQHGTVVRLEERMEAPVQVAPDAHPGWVSSVAQVGGCVVSAGADGVVKVWTEELKHLVTFPCHADSVYGIAGGDSAFATVSYEGRVAVNYYPVKR